MSPPQPIRGSVERRELPSGVRGEARAANAFSEYSKPQNAFRRKKIVIVMYSMNH